MKEMMPIWKFEKKLKNSKARNPVQAGFFSNSSIEDDTHAFIRECIQNSLDASKGADKPTMIRMTLGAHAAGSKVPNEYFSKEEWEHFSAGTYTCPSWGEECRYMVFEDFNTTGLVGNVEAFEPESGNAFYYFWRAEGESGKEEGDRGRHGIGKFCIPYLSAIRSFIALTVRSDDKKCFIAGQSVLKNHKLGEQQFTPDAWWGKYDEEGFQLPVESADLLEQLKKDFSVSREASEPGLSVIVPYINKEASLDLLTVNVLSEYFYPILRGDLVVELADNDEKRTINSASLLGFIDQLPDNKRLKKAAPYIRLANSVVQQKIDLTINLTVPDKPIAPKWKEEYLTPKDAEKIKSVLMDDGGVVQIRANVLVKLEEGSEYQTSYIDLYLLHQPKTRSLKPIFVREGIIISEDKVPNVSDYVCLAIIEDGPLATLLGDSENPAHTEWEKSAEKFKGKYKWGPTTIDFVRYSFKKVLALLSQADDEVDKDILSDIFYITLPDNDDKIPRSKRKKLAKESDVDDSDAPFDDFEVASNRRTYRLSQTDNGFKVTGPKDPLDSPREYVIKVAYDTGATKKRVFSDYDEADFNIKNNYGVESPEHMGVEDLVLAPNEIRFTAMSEDFEVVVNGFDPHRDLLVDVASEVSEHEAH
jgi:hypothetical protein